MSDTPSQVELVEQLYDENQKLKERIKRMEAIAYRAASLLVDSGAVGVADEMLTILEEAKEAKP